MNREGIIARKARLGLALSPRLKGLVVFLAVAGGIQDARADVLTQDAEARKQMELEAPAAAALMKDAEAAAARGQIEAAAGLFARARGFALQSPLPARRQCEMLVALGRKAEALAACDRAKALGAGPLEMRSTVSAYLAGPDNPSVDDLAHAWFYADLIHRKVPTLAPAYGARCEIAQRIGDGRLLQSCLDDLLRLAPDDAETKRVLAATARTPWAAYSIFGLIALASLATLAHSLLRSLAPRMASQRRVVSALLLVFAAASALGRGAEAAPATPTIADHEKAARAMLESQTAKNSIVPKGALSGEVIDDADPENSVPGPEAANENPLNYGYIVQDLLAKAEVATKKNDHAAAVKFYRAVVKMVPDRAVGFRMLCDAYEKAHDRERAIKACALALSAEGVTVDDSARFVRLVLGKPGPLADTDRAYVLEVVEHLRKQPGTLMAAHHLQCELALRLSDVAMLKTCSTALAERAPADPKTLSFQWALAMHQGDRAHALQLIERTKQSGASPDGVREMEAITASSLRGPPGWALLLGLGALAALGIVGARVLVTRRRASPRTA